MKTRLKITDKETPGDRLIYIRNLTSLSRAEFCRRLNISYNSLKEWEYKSHSLTFKSADFIVRRLMTIGVICTTDWILEGKGESPQKTDQVKSENQVEMDQDFLILNEIEIFKGLYKNLAILMITTNDFRPYYNPGDYVLGIKYSDNDILTKAMDKLCIIETSEGIKYLKVLNAHVEKSIYEVSTPFLDTTSQIDTFEILYAAPIFWHRLRIH